MAWLGDGNRLRLFQPRPVKTCKQQQQRRKPQKSHLVEDGEISIVGTGIGRVEIEGKGNAVGLPESGACTEALKASNHAINRNVALGSSE